MKRKFTAFARLWETEDRLALNIECEANQESVIAAVELELLQEMVSDGLAEEGTLVDVVAKRGYDLNGVIEGWHEDVFNRLPGTAGDAP